MLPRSMIAREWERAGCSKKPSRKSFKLRDLAPPVNVQGCDACSNLFFRRNVRTHALTPRTISPHPRTATASVPAANSNAPALPDMLLHAPS